MFAIWTTQDVVAWLTLLQVWGFTESAKSS